MDAHDSLLNQIENIASSGGSELWLKVILVILTLFSSVGGLFLRKFLKDKARTEKAKVARSDDIKNSIRDNDAIEDQNAKDGRSVRDWLRGKK